MTKRILIVRLSAIGDAILSVPVACALREAFPDARISWLVQRAGSHLLQHHPAIDDLVVIPKLSLSQPSGFARAIQLARSVKPDISIDIQGLAKSAILAYLSGAKTRIGFAASQFDGREGSVWFNNTIVEPDSANVVKRGLELLKPLGIDSPRIEYNLAELDADRLFATQFVQSSLHGAPFAAINVGAGWVSKLWPSDRYAAVARHLQDVWNLKSIILWGGASEEVIAKDVVAKSDGAGLLAPPTSLPQLRSFLRQARISVGSDTGPTHLSVAVGTPTVALIGPMPTERVGLLGSIHRTVQNVALDKDKYSERKTNMGPMLSIDAQSVCEACDSILRG